MIYGFVTFISSAAIGFNLVKLIIALLLILIILIFVAIKTKNRLVIIGVAAYGLIALVPCLYAFLLTMNVGFLALVIADITLLPYVLGIYTKDWYLYVSNCIFYTGIILVPLTLQTATF